MPVPEPSPSHPVHVPRRLGAAASTALLLACLLAMSACTTDYIESAVRIGSAELGAQPQFRWTRTSSLRIAGASSVYVAILPAGSTMPSDEHEPTFRDFTANDLPWRLARLLGDAWDGPYAVVVAPGPQPLPEALAAAALAGATYVAVPQLRDDGGPRSLWHRRTFTLEVALLESTTARPVDRILVEGRAAFDEDEVPEAALVATLNELARAMTGDPTVTDDRLGYLFR
jgi:hypothetical protein